MVLFGLSNVLEICVSGNEYLEVLFNYVLVFVVVVGFALIEFKVLLVVVGMLLLV